MKKLLMTALIASLLLIPLGNTALAGYEEAAPSAPVQDYLPGDVPAEISAAESMTPAIHALLLAMLNQGTDDFDFNSPAQAWEGLYNMLSLYGQLDSRCDKVNGELALPEETVWDYAAALSLRPDGLGELPASLRDRMNYNNTSHDYLLVCGEDGLTQVRMDGLRAEGARLMLTGSLIDEAEDEILARFQAELQPRDNMFGYAVTALSLVS